MVGRLFKCYVVICGDCGHQWEMADAEGNMSERDARQNARLKGWAQVRSIWFCPDCKERIYGQ